MTLSNWFEKILKQISLKYPSNTAATPQIGETRGVRPTESRGVKLAEIASTASQSSNDKGSLARNDTRAVEHCPYCNGKDITKWGHRKKKYEVAQLYYCNHCKKTFTAPKAKGKSFPLRVILEGLCLYNIGYSAEEASGLLKEQFGMDVNPRTLRDWTYEYAALCRYSRLRPYGMKLYTKHQAIQTVHLFHRQVYDFSVHRAKLALILQEHAHARFGNLREFLEAIQAECPHQFFQDGERSSEQKVDFDIQDVIIREKSNFATRIADLALQASQNKHCTKCEIKEDVMSLCNDAVVFLEQIRDIYADDVDSVVFNDIVKEYFFSRRKIFNLYKAWRRIDERYASGK